MNSLTFKCEEREYVLTAEDCTSFYNDEIKPVDGITEDDVIGMFAAAVVDELTITKEYYKDPCEKCPPVERSKKEMVAYNEMHLFLFTKNQKAVMTNVAPEFQELNFTQLLEEKRVDDSYVVSLIVCPVCGKYQIQIDQVDM